MRCAGLYRPPSVPFLLWSVLYSPPCSSTKNSVFLGGLAVGYASYVPDISVLPLGRSDAHHQIGSVIIALNGLISNTVFLFLFLSIFLM